MSLGKKEKLKKIIAFLGALIITFTSFQVDNIVASATDYTNNFLIKAEVQNSSGVPVTSLGLGESFRVYFQWVIGDSITIAENDTMTFYVPQEITMTKSETIFIKDGSNVVASAAVNKTTGKITITFTNYYETNSLNKRGELSLWSNWNQTVVSAGNDVDIDLGKGNTSINITGTGLVNPAEKLFKWGWIPSADKTQVNWAVRVNYNGLEIENAVYTDYIGEKQTLIPGSVKVQPGTYSNTGDFTPVGSLLSGIVVEADDLKSFVVNFGDLTGAVQINYSTQTDDLGYSSQYENSGKLVGDNLTEILITVFTPTSGGSGSGNGTSRGSVVLTKTDEDGIELAGVKFDLQNNTGTPIQFGLETGETGKILIPNLMPGKYQLVEVATLAGFVLDGTPLPFEIIANQSTPIVLSMINKRIPPLPTSIILTATKALEGKTLVKNQFEFELLDTSGNVIQTKSNEADGVINFDEIIYDQVGEYKYEIREKSGTDQTIIYDKATYKATVKVENISGQLVATTTYDKKAAFVNKYVPKKEENVPDKKENIGEKGDGRLNSKSPKTGESNAWNVSSWVFLIFLSVGILILNYKKHTMAKDNK